MPRYATKSVVSRIYKVSPSEKALIKGLKQPIETWYECLQRLGRAVDALDISQKEPREENLRLDLPTEVFERLRRKAEQTGFPMLTLLIKAAEQLASALPDARPPQRQG